MARRLGKLIGGPLDGAVVELEGGAGTPSPHVPEVHRLPDGTAYELMEARPWWMEIPIALEFGQFPYVYHRYNRGGLVGSR